MKPNGICPGCDSDVRWIILEKDGNRRKLPIDAKADRNGRLYIDHWEDQQPVLFQVDTPEQVPAHVPVRYTLHQCQKGQQ